VKPPRGGGFLSIRVRAREWGKTRVRKREREREKERKRTSERMRERERARARARARAIGSVYHMCIMCHQYMCYMCIARVGWYNVCVLYIVCTCIIHVLIHYVLYMCTYTNNSIIYRTPQYYTVCGVQHRCRAIYKHPFTCVACLIHICGILWVMSVEPAHTLCMNTWDVHDSYT